MCCRALFAIALYAATAAGIAGAVDFGEPGPFRVGLRTATVTRSDGTTFSARLFYPAARAGFEAPLSNLGGPFPLVAFGHGYLIVPGLYEQTLSHWASWGLVVAAPESGLELFPSHAAFAADLSFALDWLTAQNTLPNGPFTQRLQTDRCGLVGHSMGAGCSVLAASAESTRLKALVTFAVAETRPSAQAVAPTIRAPQFYVVGSQDRIVPWKLISRPIFDTALSPKALWLIRGGSHCGFLDRPLPIVCDEGALPRSLQLTIARRLSTAVFQLYLADKDDVWPLVWDPAQLSPTVTPESVESGVQLAQSGGISAPGANQAALLTITVTNGTPQPQTISLTATGPGTVTIAPQQVGPLAPGESSTCELSVTPGLAVPTAAVQVVGRLLSDGHTRGILSIPLPRPENR